MAHLMLRSILWQDCHAALLLRPLTATPKASRKEAKNNARKLTLLKTTYSYSTTMASISRPRPFLHPHSNPTSLNSSPLVLSFPFQRTTSLHPLVSAIKSDGDEIGSRESFSSNLLGKLVISPSREDLGGNSEEDKVSD